VLGVALLVRAITALQIAALPLSRNPHFDSLEYLGWARRVAAGDFTWPALPPHGPGYPYVLGALLAIFGGSLVAAVVVQSVVGAMTCWLVARTTRALFGARAGLAAGLILAVYAPLIWIDASIVAEGLLIFTMALALWSAATERHPALTGAILGVATLIRPTALILLPLLLVFGARTWRLRGVLAAVTIAVIAPVTIANWRASHAFIPVQAFGGINVYLGNSPLRDGLASARPGADWERLEPEAARRGADEERYFMTKTRQEIAQHPLAYAALLGKKLVRTFQNDEPRDTHSFYFFRGFAPLLWLAPFAILFGLAAAGAFVADWHARGTRLVAGYVALTAITSVALVVGARYRMPMVIGLAPFAGLAIDRIRQRQIVIVAVVAAALTLVWRDAHTHNVAEEWALTSESLTLERNAAEAESAARKALEIDGSSALAHDALAAALAAAGRINDAVAEERRTTALNPDFATAHFHLGQLHEQLNDLNAAADDYRRAVAANPHDPRPLQRLAQVELHRGNVEGALDATSRLSAQHEDPDTLFDLARLQGAVGKAKEGLASARRAMALREPGADEWLLIATLATDAHDYAAAQQAIDRAQAAGAPAAPIMFNTALLRFREGKLDEAAQLLDELLARMPDFEQGRQLREAVEQARRR
jgi:tetratricopeptide (TPR) repeat protein